MMLAFCMLHGSVMAQSNKVYETRGPNGPVYSDKPSAGARVIELAPLNVMEAPPKREPAAVSAAPAAPVAPEKAVAPAYRSFAIVSPEHDGSVAANNGAFEVRVVLEPALSLVDGHALTVSLNGTPVGRRFTANEFMIPPEFWGGSLPAANQRYQLDAAVVDGNGQVLKKAAPTQFTLRQQISRPLPPKYPPRLPPVMHAPEPESPVEKPVKPKPPQTQGILR